jgi:hypothetical protein
MQMNGNKAMCFWAATLFCGLALSAEDFPKPYSPPCTERENVFEFTEKPQCRFLGDDKYEITFAVKGRCDVTVGLIDEKGTVVRHIASGVLGSNAPEPFQKNSLKQTIYWNGKDDLETYVREPAKLRLRVMLGLKPTFDKFLGPTDPKALPGYIWALAADPDGVYVFTKCAHRGHVSWRKFDHDAGYVKELYPPSAKAPWEKLGGMGFIRHETGKRALHSPAIHTGTWQEGGWMPDDFDGDLYGITLCRPAVVDGRIYLLSSGGPGVHGRRCRNKLHFFNTDGSTDYDGVVGRPWFETDNNTQYPRLASAPDGKTLYCIGVHGRAGGTRSAAPVLLSGPANGTGLAKALVGNPTEPGADDRHFNNPSDVACDAEGRIYVADHNNNRVQIFTADGRRLKTLNVERPELIQVHQKTGVVYVGHWVRLSGKSVPCLTRFAPFPDMSEQRRWDDIPAFLMVLDSWSPQPRLWIAGRAAQISGTNFSVRDGALLRIYEDAGDELRLICDFEKAAHSAADADRFKWPGGMAYSVVCDPVREKAYFNQQWIFDLQTGRLDGPAALSRHSPAEIAFDKSGYLHLRHGNHAAPKNVVRVDPERTVNGRYAEVPYDYGEEWEGYLGALSMPATDTQFYSWGLGVNPRGDLASMHYIGYSPRFQDDVDADIGAYFRSGRGLGVYVHDAYAKFSQGLKDKERIGEALFFIRPRPGIDLVGNVIWTFQANGELENREAVLIGQFRANGVQLDEDGFLYFTNGRQRFWENRLFLQGQGGNIGGEPYAGRNVTPFTGTYVKTAPGRAVFRIKQPRIAAESLPTRMPDLATPVGGGLGVALDGGGDTWAEGVEWLYAGASPIVAKHCSCPQMRASLDWYKRSFVPENYRHSVGVLDANGNLIVHVGQYGNFDDCGKTPFHGDGVALTRGAFVSTTDNHLCIADWGRRLIVVALLYHEEETVPVKMK